MITLEYIKENAQDHPHGGKVIRIGNDQIFFSIVGGRNGLYGDFENDFEVAVMDSSSKDFITKYYFEGLSDDVIGYMEGEKLVEVLNRIFKEGFRVL